MIVIFDERGGWLLYYPISHEMHVVHQFNMVIGWKTYPEKTRIIFMLKKPYLKVKFCNINFWIENNPPPPPPPLRNFSENSSVFVGSSFPYWSVLKELQLSVNPSPYRFILSFLASKSKKFSEQYKFPTFARPQFLLAASLWANVQSHHAAQLHQGRMWAEPFLGCWKKCGLWVHEAPSTLNGNCREKRLESESGKCGDKRVEIYESKRVLHES